jgi:hypothetical protein
MWKGYFKGVSNIKRILAYDWLEEDWMTIADYYSPKKGIRQTVLSHIRLFLLFLHILITSFYYWLSILGRGAFGYIIEC